MPYEIVKGMPIPTIAREGRWCLERFQMNQLDVNDCLIVGEANRVNACYMARRALRPKKFVVRKLRDGRGWGVWRVE